MPDSIVPSTYPIHRFAVSPRQLIAPPRKRRVVDEAPGERRRNRDDRSTGANVTGFARHDDARRILEDRSDRPSESDRVAEVRREPDGGFLKSAHESILLRAALRADERSPAPAGANVEEHVQERQAPGSAANRFDATVASMARAPDRPICSWIQVSNVIASSERAREAAQGRVERDLALRSAAIGVEPGVHGDHARRDRRARHARRWWPSTRTR